jgi:hypothetical protein
VSTTEELLERKSSGSGLQNREYGRRDPSSRPRDTFYPQKLALTSPTSGGRSIGIVPSRTQATEFLDLILPAALDHGVYSASNRNEYQKQKKCFWGETLGRCVGVRTLPPSMSRLSRQCGILNISQPHRPSRPVTGIALLYFTLLDTRSRTVKPRHTQYIHIYIYIYITCRFVTVEIRGKI